MFGCFFVLVFIVYLGVLFLLPPHPPPPPPPHKSVKKKYFLVYLVFLFVDKKHVRGSDFEVTG